MEYVSLSSIAISPQDVRDVLLKLKNTKARGPYFISPRLLKEWATILFKKGKRKVQGVPQSQTAALPRPQEEEETDKSKQAQTEQTYEKH